MTPIPAIDLKGGRCVRLIQGRMDSETVYADDPLSVLRRWEAEGAERLHLVDLDGAVAGETIHADLIATLLKAAKVPVEVGGGIRQISTIEKYLAAGASWVVLGTSALQDVTMIREAARAFPGQIIVGIDTKKGAVAIRGWTEIYPDSAIEVAMRMVEIGVAAFILTDIEKDGMLEGPNFSLFETVTAAVPLPVIASGGITTPAHLRQLSKISGVQGAIIGKALYTGAITLSAARSALRAGGPC